MATATKYNKPISSDISDGQPIFVQSPDSSWALDLNTLVTIVFGVISIAFQACHMYYARAKLKRNAGPIEDDIENDGERLLARRKEAQFIMWRPQHNWDELEEYKAQKQREYNPSLTWVGLHGRSFDGMMADRQAEQGICLQDMYTAEYHGATVTGKETQARGLLRLGLALNDTMLRVNNQAPSEAWSVIVDGRAKSVAFGAAFGQSGTA